MKNLKNLFALTSCAYFFSIGLSARATEIVTLGYKGGLVMVADKRTTEPKDRQLKITGDSKTKIHVIGKYKLFAAAGIDGLKVSSKSVQGKNHENILVDSKKIADYLKAHTVSISDKASLMELAKFVADHYKPVLDLAPKLLVDIGFEMAIISFDPKTSTVEAIILKSLVAQTDNGLILGCKPIPLKTKTRKDFQFFRLVIGARSPRYESTLKLSKELPLTESAAISIAAKEILSTYKSQNGSGNVGPTCDAFTLNSKGAQQYGAGLKLEKIVEGKLL